MLLFVAGFSSLSVRVAGHLLTGLIQKKKLLKHGTGGLTMDIKTRIANMTEAEAKAALEEMIGTLALMRHTFSDDNMTLEDQENHYLDMALFMQREARE